MSNQQTIDSAMEGLKIIGNAHNGINVALLYHQGHGNKGVQSKNKKKFHPQNF